MSGLVGRRVTAFGIASVLAATLLVAGTGGNSYAKATSEGPDFVTAQQRPKVISLAHPVSVSDALAITTEAQATVLELRFSGNGATGGLGPVLYASPESQAAWAKTVFRKRFGRSPLVAKIIFAPKTSDATVSAVREKLARAPTSRVADEPATANYTPLADSYMMLDDPSTRAADVHNQRAQDFDEHFPSAWEAISTLVIYSDGTERHAYENYFTYDSVHAADPDTFPDDWGMEIGITIYNFDLADRPRPLCPFDRGDSDIDFWAQTYQTGFVWATNVPEAAKPYPDSNIESDPCNANSLEFGIGYPRELAQNTLYNMYVELAPGTQNSSIMSASMTMQSNDCNDIFLDPNTNCMGLNTSREPPAGFDASQLLVNRDRDWRVPGCFGNADGRTSPIYVLPGERSPINPDFVCPEFVFFD